MVVSDYLLKPDISHAREEFHLKLQLLFIETEHLIFICKERDDYQFSSQYTEHSFKRQLKICAQKGRWLSPAYRCYVGWGLEEAQK